MNAFAFWQFLICLAVVFSACQGADDGIARTSDTLRYEVDQKQKVVLSGTAIVSSQTIVVEVNDRDTGDGMWELVTAGDLRSNPVEVHRKGSRAELIFLPVHSREFFQATGLRGDIDGRYLLNFHSGDKIQTAEITANGDIYSAAVQRFGLKSTTIAYAIDPERFKLATNTVSDREGRANHVSGTELLWNGLWMKLQAHRRLDKLKMNLRFVNQTGSEVKVDPAAIRLFSSGPFSPEAVAVVNIPDGQRGEVTFEFDCPAAMSYRVDFSGITSGGKPVISSEVHLRKIDYR